MLANLLPLCTLVLTRMMLKQQLVLCAGNVICLMLLCVKVAVTFMCHVFSVLCCPLRMFDTVAGQ